MKDNMDNGLDPIIAQAIEEMKAEVNIPHDNDHLHRAD